MWTTPTPKPQVAMSQSRSPEQQSFVVGDHLNLSTNADLLERSYASNPYNGTSSTSSSKAVLAALRALQDKIRRLEAERSQALDEAAQLRHQLKNQEVEAEHAKQRDQLAAQKSLHEVRAAYERLLTEKSELEVRLSKFDEKNKQAQAHVDELQTKIRVLEDEKHAGAMKLKDLEHQKTQIEAQIRLAQQKEEEVGQSMAWEAKRHEEAVSFNQKRIQSLQEELAEVCQEKGSADAKLMEMDQLVAQLLSVNESLVGQLTGKPLKHEVLARKPKKVKKVPVPRAATLSTASVDAGRVTKFSRRTNSHLVPVMAEDAEALQSMHQMYKKIAKSLKKSAGTSPMRSSSSAGKRAQTAPGASTLAKATKQNTRLARKKAQLIEQFNQEARESLEYSERFVGSAPASYSSSAAGLGRPPSASDSHPYPHTVPASEHRHVSSTTTPRAGSVEVRLPRASYESGADVSGDFDDLYQRNASFLNHSTAGPANGAPHVSFTQGAMSPVPPATQYTTRSSSTGPQPGNKADMQNVISALEDEFEQLNLEYRRLLNSVQSTESAAGNGADLARQTAPPTQESIERQASELVNVIQKLHKKGEQLRTLKSSP